MPKQGKRKSTRKHHATLQGGYKRYIEDRNLTTFNHVSHVEHYPKYERICSEVIRPSNGSNYNDVGSFVFDITTGKNEIILISANNQLCLEGRTYVGLRGSKLNANKELEVDPAKQADDIEDVLHTQTKCVNAATRVNNAGDNHNTGYTPWRYGIGTGPLILFNECNISYNGQVNDDTSSWPERGQCYNQEASIALYTCGDEEHINREESFGHFIPFSDVAYTQGSKYELATRKNFHFDQNDYKDPTKKAFSPRFYVTIPGYPFRSLTKWSAKDGGFKNHKTIIPPCTSIKIVLRKNKENAIVDLGDNPTVISTYDNRLCTPRTPWAAGSIDLTSRVRFHYDDIYITVQRAIPEPKFTLYKNGQFTCPFNYNRFNFYDLPTGATIYSPRITWETSRTPDVVFLYFIRDLDLVNVPDAHLTLSSNRFFLPLGLKSIKIQQRSQLGLEPLTCLWIKNMDVRDYHDSKLAYYNYLKSNGFLAESVRFEQLFQVENTGGYGGLGMGSLNIFPINFRTLTNIERSVFLRGLKVTLEFNTPLAVSWKLVAMYQYQGVVRYRTMGEDRPPSVSFETIE